MNKIKRWQKKLNGHVSYNAAMELADSFTDDCRNRIPTPRWAFALRVMAGRIRLLEAVQSKQEA